MRLAKELGINRIAEGIETQAQADFLMSSGCEAAKGFLFCTPVSAEEMTLWLHREAPTRRAAPPKLTVIAS